MAQPQTLRELHALARTAAENMDFDALAEPVYKHGLSQPVDSATGVFAIPIDQFEEVLRAYFGDVVAELPEELRGPGTFTVRVCTLAALGSKALLERFVSKERVPKVLQLFQEAQMIPGDQMLLALLAARERNRVSDGYAPEPRLLPNCTHGASRWQPWASEEGVEHGGPLRMSEGDWFARES